MRNARCTDAHRELAPGRYSARIKPDTSQTRPGIFCQDPISVLLPHYAPNSAVSGGRRVAETVQTRLNIGD